MLVTLTSLMILLASTEAFKFAFLDNELYFSTTHQVVDRAYQTGWGLIQLLNKYKNIPDVALEIQGVESDYLQATRDPFVLAFWRYDDDNVTTLWPEHDYFGWAENWYV
jgi:hypothetical protein